MDTGLTATVQLNVLLLVAQSKFKPSKREFVCRGIDIRQVAPVAIILLVHSINWLAKRKTLNDFTVYLRNMI